MTERAMAAGVPFACAVADSIHGVGEIKMARRRQAKATCPGQCQQSVQRPRRAAAARAAKAIAQKRDAPAWQFCLRAKVPEAHSSMTGLIWKLPAWTRTSSSPQCAAAMSPTCIRRFCRAGRDGCRGTRGGAAIFHNGGAKDGLADATGGLRPPANLAAPD